MKKKCPHCGKIISTDDQQEGLFALTIATGTAIATGFAMLIILYILGLSIF